MGLDYWNGWSMFIHVSVTKEQLEYVAHITQQQTTLFKDFTFHENICW